MIKALQKPSVFILLVSFFAFAMACEKSSKSGDVEVTGILVKQGITTYQYGTHLIGEFAVRSETIDLDAYEGQTITVIGDKIEGYPVENGPEYLEVVEVR